MPNLHTGRNRALLAAAQAAPIVWDEDALVLIARLSPAPSDAWKVAINKVFTTIKERAGLWAKLDRLGCFAMDDVANITPDWRASTKSFTINGTGTFTAKSGWAGNGVDGYISFNELPNAAGNVYAQNNAHASVYCSAELGGGGSKVHIGDAATPSQRMYIQAGKTGNDSIRVNDATSSTPGTTSAVRTGYRAASRAVSTDKVAWRDGVNLGTTAVASVGVGNAPILVLRNQTAYGTDRIAFVTSGGAIDDGDVAAMYSAFQTFLADVAGL